MNIIKFLIKTRDQIQLYHWRTSFYSRHKVSDDLYTSLNELIDRFVEVYLSKHKLKFPKKLLLIKIEDENFTDYLQYVKDTISNYKVTEPDLNHIKDEILEAISTAIYLSHQK